MKADPGRSLDTTNMYVFHDKSSFMTPLEESPYRNKKKHKRRDAEDPSTRTKKISKRDATGVYKLNY